MIPFFFIIFSRYYLHERGVVAPSPPGLPFNILEETVKEKERDDDGGVKFRENT
jgi:hypothetical protein